MAERRRLSSWVDAAMRLVDRAPGPLWLSYAVLVILSVAITVGVRMLQGAPIDVLVIVFAALTFTPLAAMDYINRAAVRALADFRPALGELEPQYDDLARRLGRTAFATGVVGAVIGITVVTVGNLTVNGAWGVSAANPVATNVVTVALQVILNSSLASFLLHQVGHLRTIARIHREATGITLWDTRPHNAFARVTVPAAIAITVPYVPAAAISAASSSNPVIAIVIAVVALVFATILFVGPLAGMRRRLVREKESQLSETDRASEVAAAKLRTAVNAGTTASAPQLQSAITALAVERERLRKVSTWPWTADTVRAFVTSLGIPIVLWFATSLLGRVLFP